MSAQASSQGSPFPVTFSPPDGETEAPLWTGREFKIGDQRTPILSYAVGESGWTDELTTFHEDTAGQDHYMDHASRSHTLKCLRRWLPMESPVIIDIGCSSGLILKLLQRDFPNGTVVGADYVRGPLESLARNLSGIPLLQFDLTNCPLPEKSFDGVVLINVLEHIERDEAALMHVARVLKPGGVAVIEVPAGPNLYDVYDKLLLHHRRYTMRELIGKISGCGLQVLEKSHLGFFLYPAFWAAKKRGRRFLNKSKQIQELIVSQNITVAGSHPLMHKIMGIEAVLRERVYYPFGIRCMITCRRIENLG